MVNKMVGQPQVEKQENGGMWKRLFKIERGKPPLLLITILILIVIILTILGVYKLTSTEHEIRIVIECDDTWDASISVAGYTEFTTGTGEREFTYTMREGQILQIEVYKWMGGPEPLTVSIYDNGELARRETSTIDFGNVGIEYTVGE